MNCFARHELAPKTNWLPPKKHVKEQIVLFEVARNCGTEDKGVRLTIGRVGRGHKSIGATHQ